jgi:hypothetical protein
MEPLEKENLKIKNKRGNRKLLFCPVGPKNTNRNNNPRRKMNTSTKEIKIDKGNKKILAITCV